MNTVKPYEHWIFKTDENGIAWLYFDKKGENANTLNNEALDELADAIATCAAHPPKGVIIASAKKSGFIAGADVREIQKLTTPEAVVKFLNKGQGICEAIEKLPCPTLAYINGFCLGGGLELSLSCDYRIAEDSPDTKMGLPEVMLGILPGWGGTVRLPRIAPVHTALEMMLTGKTLRAKAAKAAGIVDECLPERVMKLAAISIILNKPPKRRAPWYNDIFRFKPARALLAKLLRKQVEKRASQAHYPSPFAIIDNWEEYGVAADEGFQAEINALEKLATNNTTQNLVRIFFLQEQLKDMAKKSKYKAQHVHVIGAGTMGGDIAMWCAMQGLRVTLQDTAMSRIAQVLKKFNDDLKKRIKEPFKIMDYRDLLIPDVKGEGIAFADVIIEAVFEDLEVKQNIFKDAEARAKSTAILATNTSSIPLDEINQEMKNPGRLVGIHFFNPVSKMQLVEVVHGEKTDVDVMRNALAFVLQLKKLPLSVKSSPGFLVNRCLTPYLLEAVALYDEGVSPVLIDRAAVKFGMPMGPIELADVVGLDICLSVADHLKEKMEVKIPEALVEKVKSGNLGKKSGNGFYKWQAGKAVKSHLSQQISPIPENVIESRLILRFLNEAMACLRENIAASADEVDAGIIFATGFAPFRGGPIHYAEGISFERVQKELKEYAKIYGERFAPDLGWEELNK